MKQMLALRTEGSVAVVFAMCLPMIMASAGIGMDLAQAYMVRQRLGHAVDAAALAGAASGTDEAEIADAVEAYFDANYPPEKIGTPYNLQVSVVGDNITVSAQADLDTMFMRVFGADTMTVRREATVVREVRGLEVVMVLDNTGSMSTNNNIGALRTAAGNFINILFDAASDPEDIKIGMVPYSSSVRVGRYGLGQNPDGSQYAAGEPFVTLPPGVSYTSNYTSSTGWYGCVVEHMEDGYDETATHVPGSYGQLWTTDGDTECREDNCNGHGWDPSAGNNDPYPHDIPDAYQGPWDIYMYGDLERTAVSYPPGCGWQWWQTPCSSSYYRYEFRKDSRPNRNCPQAGIMPLTSDQAALIANVNSMQAGGNTLSNIGMAWGYRVISPDFPFEEGAEWDDQEWRKAVMMMTDGETMMGTEMTSYWFTDENNINNSTLDDRLEEICAALKDNGVLVYTVTFAAGVPEQTKASYRACATSDAFYFDAPSQSDLIEVFENIARQLANLHLSH